MEPELSALIDVPRLAASTFALRIVSRSSRTVRFCLPWLMHVKHV